MSKPTKDQPKIEHTKGGSTTKDATDLGVPMKPVDPAAPPRQGPEDALEPNQRGDYSDRLGGAEYNPTHVERVREAKPGEPTARVVKQKKES